MARQIDALLLEIVVLLELQVTAVMYVHGGWVVDLRWVQRENSETEDREIVCRTEVAPVACDPAPSAPWLSQTPTRPAMRSSV